MGGRAHSLDRASRESQGRKKRVSGISSRMHRLGFVLVALVSVAVGLAVAAPARAASVSTADLEGTWSLFQIGTPKTSVSAADVRTFSSACPTCTPIAFDATGAVTAGVVTDDLGTFYNVSGSLALSPAGLLSGTLTLDDTVNAPGMLIVREGRILVNKHTIVGAAEVFGDVGLFTFVKLEAGAAGSFTLATDLAGDWNYHEITPSNNIPRTTPGAAQGDASYTRGTITFHGDSGCTEADLVLADGTVRATRTADPTSFG
jgi:hypothetical protein